MQRLSAGLVVFRGYHQKQGFSREEIDGVLGVYNRNTGQLTVVYDSNLLNVKSSIAHERLHQLSSTRIGARGGSHLDEGITELFTQRASRDIPLKGNNPVYGKEQILAQKLKGVLAPKLWRRPGFVAT